MRKAAFFLLSFSVAFGIACGGGTAAPKTATGGATSGLKFRAFVTNTFRGAFQIVDASRDQVSFTNAITVGATPTSMTPSVNSKYTLVYAAGSPAITSVENLTESSVQEVFLQNFSPSFVVSSDNKSGFAAVPAYQNATGVLPGAIQCFNYIDASVSTVIPVPSASYVAIDHAGKHLLVFTNNSDAAYWVDLTTADFTKAVQSIAAPIAGLTLNAPSAAFFSSDDTSVYILNCGPECGGTGSPNVTQMNIATMAATGSVNVQAGRIGTVVSGTTLWVAGSPGGTGGAVQPVTLSTLTAGAPITAGVSDGNKIVLRFLNSKLWMGATNCTTSSCLTIIDPASNTAKLGVPSNDPNVSQIPTGAPNPGDVTGMTFLDNRTLFYVVEGGHVHLYDNTGTQQVMLNNFIMQGKAYDVLALQ